MYKSLLILILLSWSCQGFCARSSDDTDLQWYQIELLIFSHEEKTADSEFWPHTDVHYPAKMVSVGPWQDELLQPTNLGQLNDIIEYQKIIESTPIEQSVPITNSQDEFLFDDRRRSATRAARSSSLDEEDLMSGLNPDIAELEPIMQVPRKDASDQSTSNDETLRDSVESLAQELSELFNSKIRMDAYRALPKEKLGLRNIARRLERSSKYRLLYHNGWRQPIVAVGQSIPILVQSGDRFDDYYELDGTVTISLARYLHLDTDLWFTSFLPKYSSPAGSQGSRRVFSAAEREVIAQYPGLYQYESRKNSYVPERTYRLVQSRRMRTAKLYYVDHPAFGLMVKVTEFDDDDFAQ